MKALQDKGVAKEGVITRLHKHIKNLTDGQEQYKSALRTGNWKRRVVRREKSKKTRRRRKRS